MILVKLCSEFATVCNTLLHFPLDAHHDFAKVTDVSNFLADKVLDAFDLGGLLEDEAGWWFVEEGAETLHVNSTVLGCEDVDHGFEAHVNGA